MEWGLCPRCGDYIQDPDKCACKPFHCWIGETEAGNDAHSQCVWASNAEHASESMVKQNFCDYAEQPHDLDVWVRANDDDKLQHFIVEIDMSPRFYAMKVE